MTMINIGPYRFENATKFLAIIAAQPKTRSLYRVG